MKEFFDHLDRIAAALQDPEYLFLVLEPLQIWGVAFGLLGLIITWFLNNEKLQVAALIVVLVSALSVWPYLEARQTAQPRIEKILAANYGTRAKQFTNHTTDRLEHRWIFLALAGIAGAAILVGPRRNRLGMGLALGCVAFSLHGIQYSLWMHYQDSLAYHPNLKQNEAPVKEKIRAEPVQAPKTETRAATIATQSTAPATATLREVRPIGGITP
ncbi:MAG: hypothetical protein JNK37_03470 [Verrucomicrobiales bacterium]|nr:hypothetical protein [Verrucomicrobiales bacterium]